MCDLSDVLKSKNKQNENYLSEIEVSYLNGLEFFDA